ncbi:MAG TPA: hypothetical protein DIW64_18635 [Cellvibrio sp.]|nr:hypothetical protein [Cellvibrio sp.]
MNGHDDLVAIDGKMKGSRELALWAIVFVLGAYFIWFFGIKGYELSSSPEVWAQFGDYAGGILNPIVALLAFYWLTVSIRYQLKELKDSRAALRDSASSQAKLVEAQNLTARIHALSAMLQTANANISTLNSKHMFAFQQLTSEGSPPKRKIIQNSIDALLKELDEEKEGAEKIHSLMLKLLPPHQ